MGGIGAMASMGGIGGMDGIGGRGPSVAFVRKATAFPSMSRKKPWSKYPTKSALKV